MMLQFFAISCFFCVSLPLAYLQSYFSLDFPSTSQATSRERIFQTEIKKFNKVIWRGVEVEKAGFKPPLRDNKLETSLDGFSSFVRAFFHFRSFGRFGVINELTHHYIK